MAVRRTTISRQSDYSSGDSPQSDYPGGYPAVNALSRIYGGTSRRPAPGAPSPGPLPGGPQKKYVWDPVQGAYVVSDPYQLEQQRLQTSIGTEAQQQLAAQQIAAQQGLQEAAQQFQGTQAEKTRQAQLAEQAAQRAEAQRAQTAQYAYEGGQAEQGRLLQRQQIQNQASQFQAQLAEQKRAQDAQYAAQMAQLQTRNTQQSRLQQEALTAQKAQQDANLVAQAARQAEAEKATLGLQTGSLAAQAARQAEAEAHQKAILEQKAGYQTAAEQRRMDALKGLLGTDVGTVGNVTVAGTSNVPGDPSAAIEENARQAAFARAKDQAGLIGRSAMTGLQEVMGARGLTGSGVAMNQAGGILSEGARQLGDVNREQMINTAQQARQRASEQYQGALTQRGQNLNYRASLAGLINQGQRAY